MTVIGIIDKANDLTINKFKIGMKIAYSFIVVDTLMLIVGYLGLHNDDIGMMEAKQAILLFLIFAVASSVLMCAGLTRSILKPLEEFDRAANMISDGDLTVDLSVSSKDELGVLADYFRKMTFNLKSVIYRVQNFAEKVTFKTQELSVSGMELKTTTNQMSNSIMEIAAGANKQASKMEEISRTMNEMSAVIQQVANGSQKTEEVAKTSSSRAQEVNKTSTVMVDKINDIQSTVEGSAGVITQLDEKSEKIGEIVGLITAIADQTSLLALNAAIEAARAGEHGRGFSVVADEVRKLAEEAGDAANQIAELIKEIQQGIKNSVKSMEQGKKTVEEGSSILKDTISNISSIAEASREAADMFHEIAAVAKTQSVSIEDVASSVENISEIATDSASAIQVAAASSQEESASMEGVMNTIQELETLSIELKDEMNRFKTSKKNQ